MQYKNLLISYALTLVLLGCGGSGDESPPTNQPPSVNAGIDINVPAYPSVSLNGSGSDNDGPISSFRWTQTSGITELLENLNSAITSFQTPEINQEEILTFELVARDNNGEK